MENIRLQIWRSFWLSGALVFSSWLPEASSFRIILLVSVHDLVIEVLFFVICVVLVWLLITFSFSTLWSFKVSEHFVEFLWTVLPVFLLLVFAFPSLLTLFALEDIPFFSDVCFLKGLQWDWEVSFLSSFGTISGPALVTKLFLGEFEDYTLLNVFSHCDSFRSLETFNCVFLPLGFPVIFQLSSEDVVHSFTVPAFGIKLDCVPGKSVEVFSFFTSCGVFHGHCAEICGAGHSIIPVEVIIFSSF